MTDANMAKLGPLADGVVGTNGQYTDLYQAMIDPAGPMWKRVLVVAGAVMSRDVVIPAGGAYTAASIIGIGGYPVSIGGGYQLSIAADDVFVDCIKLSGAVGKPNITISGNRARLHRVYSLYATTVAGHGIAVTVGSHFYFIECYTYGNGGNGISLSSGSIATVLACHSQGNTGWGLYDASGSGNNLVALGNVIWGNTAGQISTTSTIVAANKTA